jgi:hypothetical protein
MAAWAERSPAEEAIDKRKDELALDELYQRLNSKRQVPHWLDIGPSAATIPMTQSLLAP